MESAVTRSHLINRQAAGLAAMGLLLGSTLSASSFLASALACGFTLGAMGILGLHLPLRHDEQQNVDDERIQSTVTAFSKAAGIARPVALYDPTYSGVALADQGQILLNPHAFSQRLFESPFNRNEKAAVIAHEISHLKNSDRDKMLFMTGNIAFSFFLSLVTGFLERRANIPALMMMSSAMLIIPFVSRQFERVADIDAVHLMGGTQDMKSMLTRVYSMSKSAKTEEKGFGLVLSRHPSLAERIENIEQLENKMAPAAP